MQMNNEANPEQGYVQGGAIYAPVDFPDAEGNDTRVFGSITNTVNHVSLYHMADMSDKQQFAKQWKKKIRDIMQSHQEIILQFFTKPIPNSHPLKSAQTILHKFGKPTSTTNFDYSKHIPTIFKDCVLDLSGQGMIEVNRYITDLEKNRSSESPYTRWMSMTKQLLEYMRDTGDELIRLDQKLKAECDVLDSVVEKVNQILLIPQPDVPGFQDVMELYVQKQFESHPIETLYWDYINTVQKYAVLRDILMPQRTSLLTTNDPICCICMTETVVIVFTPCGHTFCTNCSKRSVACHICRQMVTNRVRIYFG
jgi:hypothetical protein